MKMHQIGTQVRLICRTSFERLKRKSVRLRKTTELLFNLPRLAKIFNVTFNFDEEFAAMKRKLAVLVAFFAMLAFVAYPGLTQAGNGLEIGATVENFSLPDTEGVIQSLDKLKGKNGTLVVWLSAQCPVVKGYKDRINEIAAEYKAKGINFVGINSNATEDLTWVKSNIAEFGYKFPVLIDKDNVLADKWGRP